MPSQCFECGINSKISVIDTFLKNGCLKRKNINNGIILAKQIFIKKN